MTSKPGPLFDASEMFACICISVGGVHQPPTSLDIKPVLLIIGVGEQDMIRWKSENPKITPKQPPSPSGPQTSKRRRGLVWPAKLHPRQPPPNMLRAGYGGGKGRADRASCSASPMTSSSPSTARSSSFPVLAAGRNPFDGMCRLALPHPWGTGWRV